MNQFWWSKYGGSEMRKLNFGEGRRAAGFFRLCLGIIVTFSLVMGGMALNTQPVQAVDIIPAGTTPLPLTECQPFTMTFSLTPTPCAPGYTPVYTFYVLGTLPPNSTFDPNTGILAGCPDIGTSGQFGTFQIVGSEFAPPWPNPWDPPCGMNWSNFGDGIVNWTIGPVIPSPPLTITPTPFQVAWENMPYTITLAATGCSGIAANYNWACTGLPAGLALDPATGIISGTPAPGTCGGPYTVMVTCTDTSMCPTAGCCPPVTAPLYFFVDCWANYLAMITTYYTTACDFTVNIGPGLAYGKTDVVIDGSPEATLAGNGSKTFTSVPCESHLVVVDQIVQGPDPKTRYTCVGSNQKWVSDMDNIAYFDYAPDMWIDTGSDPAGVTQPPNAGFYAVGANFISSAPSPVQSNSQQGTKYIFRAWRLPDGSTNPSRDLWFIVNVRGTATALYDTYYELILKSDFPAVLEKSWEPAGSNAKWKLALQPVPFPNFFGALGGVYEPTNAEGSHNMTGPYTQEIMWRENWFWPIFWIVVTLLAIAAAIFFILRNRKKQSGAGDTAGGPGAPTQPRTDAVAEKSQVKPAVSATPEKTALPEAEPTRNPDFCPNCGNPVDREAKFCKKCGNKL
jgi:hypothetical protein